MQRPRVLTLIGLLLSLTLFAGCGSSSDSDDPAPAAPSVQTSQFTDAAIADYFVSTDYVATNRSNLLIVDVRSAQAYNAGHIEGAINAEHTTFIYTRTDGVKYILLPQTQFIDLANRLGITNDSTVVVYGEDTNPYAARLAWSLNYYGHQKAYTLDGGITKWSKEGRALATDPTLPTATSGFTVAGQADNLALAGEVQNAIGKSEVVLFDTRAIEEYTGVKPLDAYRTGHLPGAAFINWLDFQKTDPSGAQVLKSREELLALLNAQGITPDKLIVPYCEGGIRSSYVTNVLKGLGYPNVRNYDGSWNEWGKFAQKNPASYPIVLETPKIALGLAINTGGANATYPNLTPGLSVIDRYTQNVVKSIVFTDRVGQSTGHFANLTADGERLWLCNDLKNITVGQGTVDLYETDGFTILKSFNVGCGVQNTLSRDGKYLFTSSTKTNEVNVFDVLGETYLGSIASVSAAPHVGDTTPDSRTYYTTNSAGGHALGYDITTLPAAIPQTPVLDVTVGGSLHAVKVHPNGKYLFVGSGTSGTNVIDLASQTIIASVPGVPHNYSISADRRYLASSELSGQRLQFIDIATLDTATPNPALVKEAYALVSPGFGGSHESWDPATGKLWYTLYRNDGRGEFWVVNTDSLPTAVTVEKIVQIGDNPHSPVFPGINAD